MSHRILLVGGPADVRRDIERHLEPLGHQVAYHWPSDKKYWVGNRLPKDATAVIGLVEIADISALRIVREMSSQLGIPYAACSRKWAVMKPRLIETGILEVSGTTESQEEGVKANALPAAPQQQQQQSQSQAPQRVQGLSEDVQAAMKMLGEAISQNPAVRQIWFTRGDDGKVQVAWEIVQVVQGGIIL